ncbi:hypothetical protein CP157_01118 [Paracoccus marcusii]|uniref:helix-turn-helix domain-containing protein n=1 Tax=Paracoccus marcusii TaxID=59779 RepID=UPI001C3D1F5E|nr:helix-turn-helix domain-containing protein [Paracoccus marcusii]QXI63400.1 hypothetical protein CP157_01118 [Paracoccus marcusii]
MSRKVATLVYERRAGSAARKAVLAYFADRADDYGKGIFSSKQTIADETELGRSTVIRIVNELVAEGILIVAGSRPCRNGSTVNYDIDLAVVRALPAIKTQADQSHSGTSQNLDQSQSGTPPVPERDPMGSQSGTQTVHEPSMNQEEDTSSSVVQHPASELATALGIYSQAASQFGWTKVEKFTDARKAALRARLKDAGGLQGWAAQIDRATRSDFLCGLVPGRNGQTFKCSLDFLVQQQSFVRLMEGFYDNRVQSTRQDHRTSSRTDALRHQINVAAGMQRTPREDCF